VDVVLDLMIHDIDLVLALSGSGIAAVSACGFRILTRDIDIANARIEFDDGCVANLSASRVSQAPVRKLRVFQSDLYASADLQAGKLRYVKNSAGALDSTETAHEKGDALAVQAAAFVKAVLKKEKPRVSGEDGLRALEVAMKIGGLVRERLARFE
jgi:predicted dehydrogenase